MSNVVVDEVQLVKELVAQGQANATHIKEGFAKLAQTYGQTFAFDFLAIVADLGSLAVKVATEAAGKSESVDTSRRGNKGPIGQRDAAAVALRSGLSATRTALRNVYGFDQVAQVFPDGRMPENPVDLLRDATAVTHNLADKAAHWAPKSNVVVVPVDVNAAVANLSQLLAKLETAKAAVDANHATTTAAGAHSLESRTRLHQIYKGLNHVYAGLLEMIGDEAAVDGLRIHHHESKIHDAPAMTPSQPSAATDAQPKS